MKARTAETINPNLPTGEVEIFARDIEVLSEAPELPLPVFGEPDYPEDTRLRYRFLDLRRESLHGRTSEAMSAVAALTTVRPYLVPTAIPAILQRLTSALIDAARSARPTACSGHYERSRS